MKQELVFEYGVLDKKLTQIKNRQKHILEEFVQFSEYKIGTRFKRQHATSTEAEIVEIRAVETVRKTITFEYYYAPVKKDGTLGSKASYPVISYEIEKGLL